MDKEDVGWIYIYIYLVYFIYQYIVYFRYIYIHIYKVDYYSAIKKDDYTTFASTWMELEETMLSEISQAEKDNYVVSLICGTYRIAGRSIGEGREE